jgi:hypothetical protein
MPTTLKGSSVEWAVARLGSAGGWARSEPLSEEEARRDAARDPNAVVIPREVLGWSESPVYVPSSPYDGSMDAIVGAIVAEENAVLRAGLERGADIAVTHIETPSNRIAHRLACQTLDTQLDRWATWTTGFRARLKDDRTFRPALPSLFTRKEASTIVGLRSCKTCWPTIEGIEVQPSRGLFAEGLKTQHIGKMLADEKGRTLGRLEEVLIRGSSKPGDRFGVESVSVRTDRGALELEPRDRVKVIAARDAEADARREAAIRRRVGQQASLTIAW